MQEEVRIKIVCRLKDGAYQQECYLDNVRQSGRTPELSGAETFLNAFSPETLVRKLTAQQENAVLVFRTTSAQMQKFCEMI